MIKFTKMQGLGNDFICMNYDDISRYNLKIFSKFVCDRHFGIGADGLILYGKSMTADCKMRIFNNDGTEAEMCGNGIRCVGKFVYDKGLTSKEEITVETLAGVKKLKLHINKGKVESVTVDMGKPILEPKEIPVISEENPVKNLKISALDKEFIFTCVSMGNPHAITIVEDVDNFDIEKYGKILEIDKHFPKRANIEFIEILDKNTIKMRVWERGARETLACGTGASAVCVACTLNNLVEKQEEITVKLLGGDLKLKWDENVYMTGPAKIVFEGEFEN